MKNYISVSASSLSTFYRCSQQYKWTFIDEREADPETASIYTIFGSTFHKAIELHYKFSLSLDEVESSWRTLFLSFCTEEKAFKMPAFKDLEKFIVQGHEYFQNFSIMSERWSKFKVIDTEKYFKIPYQNKYLENVFLTGRIDLLLNGEDNSIVCLDWKTAKSKDSDVDRNTQLTFYMYFIREVYRQLLDQVYGGLVYPFDGKILFSQRTEKDFEGLFKNIDIMLERVSKSDFKKEPKIGFLPGDCHFCQYKKTCEQK